MVLELYYFHLSPPSRAAWIVLEELGIKYEKKAVDVFSGQQKTEDYKKINPRQKVPALKDGDFCIAESRAIAQYLVNKYGAQQGKESLYPTNPEKRGRVDQQLFISENTTEQILTYVNIAGVLFREEDKKAENLEKAQEAVQAIEDLLVCTKYTAGNDFTLSDIFYIIALGFLDMVDFDFAAYPKVVQWKAEMAAKPWYKEVWADNHLALKGIYHSKKAGGKKA